MPINILMPALSPTMEKGNLAKWLKKEGDNVKAGDVIAEIETDKATMEVEAVDDGVLAKIVVPEGTPDVPVNDLIAVLAGEGEDPKSAAAAAKAGDKSKAGAPAPAPSPTEKSVERAPQPKGGEAGPVQPSGEPGADRRNMQAELQRPAAAPSPPPPVPGAPKPAPRGDGHAGRIFASPLARRLAREAGMELQRIAGSGPHGRIIARDVESAKGEAPKPAAAAPAPGAPEAAPPAAVAGLAPSDEKIRALFTEGTYETVPHDSMRKIIAQRLTQSKQTIPHFYLTIDCDIGKLLAAREEINASAPKSEDGKPRFKLSVNDFVIKALALSLQRVPEANVTWTEAAMLKHKHSDVGVAVAIKGGLITPVVRGAEQKSLSAISDEMKDLAARARTRRLKPDEYQGGTTAISNLGMYGIREFAAVINPPHATILAVGTGEERAVVHDGKIEIASMMTVTLSTDHRAVDGALGAELMAAFKTLIESPVMMLV